MDVFEDVAQGWSDVYGVGIAGRANNWQIIIYQSEAQGYVKLRKLAEYGPYPERPTQREAFAIMAMHFATT